MSWMKDASNRFRKDELRRSISNINWYTFKPKLKEQLIQLANILSDEDNELSVIDMDDNPDGYGFDCLTLCFRDRMTGNMRQEITKEYTRYNYHWQKGAALSITYSATGAVHMIIFPSTSEDSLAKHDSLILHHSYNVKDITPKKLEKAVKNLLHFHRVTGVLHKATLIEVLIVKILRLKMYFIQYADKESKFKRITALYIPLLSLLVSLSAAIASIFALIITMKTSG
ncbi:MULTISPECIES: hypothetical protein [Serratia]|uniref:hypothetical protein n=1 Tax=Serratia TaxID=613 RepID=UPI001E521AEC|nr:MULTISPECIES: hypothetical protein [Serratia]